MGHSHNTGKLKSEGKKSLQQRRTHKNKIKKYQNLTEESPTSLHINIWRQKLEHSKQKI